MSPRRRQCAALNTRGVRCAHDVLRRGAKLCPSHLAVVERMAREEVAKRNVLARKAREAAYRARPEVRAQQEEAAEKRRAKERERSRARREAERGGRPPKPPARFKSWRREAPEEGNDDG